MIRAFPAALIALAAMACAGGPPGGASAVPGKPILHQAEEDPAPAETVAQLLARAEAAAAAADTGALSRQLGLLDALGARPAADADSDPVPGWRNRAGAGAAPLRGRALGPAYRRGTLAGDSEIELTQTFLSGRKAVVAVSSPAGVAPALRVVSASGTRVCDSAVRCRWTPVFTERYAIILRNPARTERSYYLVID